MLLLLQLKQSPGLETDRFYCLGETIQKGTRVKTRVFPTRTTQAQMYAKSQRHLFSRLKEIWVYVLISLPNTSWCSSRETKIAMQRIDETSPIIIQAKAGTNRSTTLPNPQITEKMIPEISSSIMPIRIRNHSHWQQSRKIPILWFSAAQYNGVSYHAIEKKTRSYYNIFIKIKIQSAH